MSRAAALITPKAAARAALFYDEHPDAYAYAVDYCERLAGKRNDKEPQDVAAVAAAIVPAFVREGREDDKAALRSAARRAVKRAAAAVAQDQDEATPYEIGEDESRTILTTYAPDPAAAYAVRSLDLTAQALLHLDDEEQREAMRLAAIGIRHGAAALTSRAMPRTMQRRISAAVADLRSLQPRILADPYGDGSGNANRGDWEGGDRTRTGSDLPPAAQPSRATLAALRSAAQEAAETRDRLRVQVALAQMENAPEDALRATVEAWQNAAREATRTTAGLAAAETHAARSARRTGAASQGITTDPAALSPYERPRHYVPKAERPAQVPEWTFSGGTARPLIGACVAARLIDTGTPGVDVTRLTITAPDGTVWATTYTREEWTADDARRLSQALNKDATTEPLTHVERILSAPRYGTPKKPSPRARSRVGSTGPTVPAKGMTR